MPEDRPLLILTGATGFVGQTLQAYLNKSGYLVRALVRKEIPVNPGILSSSESLCISLTSKNPEQIRKLQKTLSEAHGIIYCAGSVRGTILEDFLDANQRGLKTIVDCLRTLEHPPPLLLISSLAASRPEISHYAQSKYLGETVLHQNPNIPWTIIRPPAIYGPADQEMRPLFDLGRRGLLPVTGPLDQRLSLLHVDDMGTAALAWLNSWKQCKQTTYAIDDGQLNGYTWPQMAQIIASTKNIKHRSARLIKIPHILLSTFAHINQSCAHFFKYAPMLTPGKVRELSQPEWLGDNHAFTKATGWVPEIKLEAGLKRMYSTHSESTESVFH